MKRVVLSLLVLCVMLIRCQRTNEPVSDTASSPNPTNTPSAPPPAASVSEAASTLLPSWRDQVAALRPDAAGADGVVVHIRFTGIVSHVFPGNTPRAVLIDDGTGGPHDHKPYLILPAGADVAAANSIFASAKCVAASPCKIPLEGDPVALKIEDANQAGPITKLQKSKTAFDKIVPTLSAKLPALKDVIKNGDLAKPVAAYFMHTGGELVADPFGCRGRFAEPGEEFKFFANSVTLWQDFAKGPVDLLVTRQNPLAKGTTWQKISFDGAYVPIVLSNNLPGGSHFDLFKKLGNPEPASLPNVELEENCISLFGDIPGCGNSAWP